MPHVFKLVKGCIEIEIFNIKPKNFAPGVEIVELKSYFAIIRLAVGVMTSHGQSMWSPPMVNLVQLGSGFCGQ